MAKGYIHIGKAKSEKSRCKIGKTKDLEERLKGYKNRTGVSIDDTYHYLFTCEVKNMEQVEKDITNKFRHFREVKSKEMYFYNPHWFDEYVKFIKSHKMFVREIPIETEEKKQFIKIIKRTKPTLEERGMSRRDLMQKAKKVRFDEFFTRYEDVEKELEMYDVKVWKDKVVFCNCDDPVGDDRNEKNSSVFALYFLQNFERLGLKKLICTHYAGVVDLFNQGPKGYISTYIFTKTRSKEYPKSYTGSF